MKKIIMRVLETCDQTQLADVMIKYAPQLELRLKASPSDLDPLYLHLLLKEK